MAHSAVISELVRLRDVEAADLELFFAHQQDPEAVRSIALHPARSRGLHDPLDNQRARRPAILVRTITVTDEPAGNIVSWWKGDRRFLGYWLGRSYWGRGVGTEAQRLFLQLEPHTSTVGRPVRRQYRLGKAVGKIRFPPNRLGLGR
ncbi:MULTISPECIES: GNAT family N-acetyltransferase [unclassified Nocardia]|uniref:GNAT family N-acetyltransferase n=1 Tax=Nocardia sp. JCM 34519.1 TaxID=2876119 RepID=UPI001CE44545